MEVKKDKKRDKANDLPALSISHKTTPKDHLQTNNTQSAINLTKDDLYTDKTTTQ